jgi:hypothetical protein
MLLQAKILDLAMPNVELTGAVLNSCLFTQLSDYYRFTPKDNQHAGG